jgi:hypothetical protein
MTTSDLGFRSEFETWRASRPAWKALVKAIREERSREDIDRLAPAAGVDRSELLDLLTQHATAKGHLEDANKLPEAKRRAAEAKRRRETAEKMLSAKGLSIAEQDEARNEFEAARIVEEANEGAVGVLQMSAGFVEGARQVGVL